jgi:peptidoglycan-associated lipoprotein
MALAEKAYATSQRLFDEKKYDESRTQAAVARQLAEEAKKELAAKPCEVPPATDPEPEAVEAQTERAEDANVTPFTVEPTSDLKTIYFDFDSVAFSAAAVKTLEENLEWLRANPNVHIVLEGHCDERGTTEYNMALGDERAYKVLNYLKQANISADRFEIVSFGSEKPASFRRDNEGYRLNRRVEFSIARRDTAP